MRMDDNKKKQDDTVKSYIEILKEAEKALPNLVLPSMGMLDNEKKVDIDVKDYFEKDSQ